MPTLGLIDSWESRSMTGDNVIPTPKDRHLFFAFSTFTGERKVLDRWYDEEHIPQILSAQGLIGAQRFVIADTKPLPGTNAIDYGHAAFCEIEGSPEAFRGEIKRMLMSGEMVLPDCMIQPLTAMFYRPVSDIFTSERFDSLTSLDDRHLLLVWSKRPDDPAVYDRWYDETHIKDFLAAPGVVRAQRFVTSDVKPLPGVVAPEHGHLALYEVEGDLGPVREEIKRQLMSGEMVLPEFMPPPFDAMFLRPVSPFVAGNAA
jgi:hypothetical protein